jgi:hypothetical protein
MNIRCEELDALLELLVLARPPGDWLIASFDDGYADAARYVRTRRERFPGIRFMFFVCPHKLSRRRAFRWDLPAGAADADPFGPPLDPEKEALRPDLDGLADQPRSQLVTPDECRELRDAYGVVLGNHSNQHLCFKRLDTAAAERELDAAHADFEALFGPCEDFAFPFGTPELQFGREHASAVFRRGFRHAWSVEARPFLPSERRPGAVLPRLPIFGTQTGRSLAAFVALRALRWRVVTMRQRVLGATPAPEHPVPAAQ